MRFTHFRYFDLYHRDLVHSNWHWSLLQLSKLLYKLLLIMLNNLIYLFRLYFPQGFVSYETHSFMHTCLKFESLCLDEYVIGVANSFDLQGAANSSPTSKHFCEGAQFLLVLKSARKSQFGRNLAILQWNTPKLSDWAPKLRNTTWTSKHPVLHFPID